MAQKTNKSFSKRLKITKNGKIKARRPGFNHFNARQNRAHQLAGRVPNDFVISNKTLARVLPHG